MTKGNEPQPSTVQSAIRDITDRAKNMDRRKFLQVTGGTGLAAIIAGAAGITSGSLDSTLAGAAVTGPVMPLNKEPLAAPATGSFSSEVERLRRMPQTATQSEQVLAPVDTQAALQTKVEYAKKGKKIKEQVADLHTKFKIGEFEVPRHTGIPVDLVFTYQNKDIIPKGTPDSVHLEGVQQYEEGNEYGWDKQLEYRSNPDKNVAIVSGPLGKPEKQILMIRGHSGMTEDGTDLPFEWMRRLHDVNPDTGKPRTVAEAAEFRKSFQAEVNIRGKDQEGKDKNQKARVTMHRISADKVTERDAKDAAFTNDPIHNERPLVTDFIDGDDRREIPDTFTEGKYATVHFCAKRLADETAKPNSRPDIEQAKIILFLEAVPNSNNTQASTGQ